MMSIASVETNTTLLTSMITTIASELAAVAKLLEMPSFMRAFIIFNYPKAISKTIMSTKPTARPIVAKLEWLPSLASGINSSTTT